MATKPKEIVNEAMERALLGMSQRYAIVVLASTGMPAFAFAASV
jgi:hypothetical protein